MKLLDCHINGIKTKKALLSISSFISVAKAAFFYQKTSKLVFMLSNAKSFCFCRIIKYSKSVLNVFNCISYNLIAIFMTNRFLPFLRNNLPNTIIYIDMN